MDFGLKISIEKIEISAYTFTREASSCQDQVKGLVMIKSAWHYYFFKRGRYCRKNIGVLIYFIMMLFSISACYKVSEIRDVYSEEEVTAEQHQGLFVGQKSEEVQLPKFSSMYTDLIYDAYFVTNDEDLYPGQDGVQRCDGPDGYYVKTSYSVMDTIYTVMKEDSEFMRVFVSTENTEEAGPMLEWRLANGKPFAVILRFYVYGPVEDKIEEYLIVEGLEGYEHIDFKIYVETTENANIEARTVADNAYAEVNDSLEFQETK